MANLLYRETMTPAVRSNSSIKGTPLSYAELDVNFVLINEELAGLADGSLLEDGAIASIKLATTGVIPTVYGTSTSIPTLTVNDRGQITSASTTPIVYPVAQIKTGTYALTGDLTSIIPLDDTIPVSTEGTEIISLSITPKSITNRLLIEVIGVGAMAASGHIVSAVFSGTTNIAASASAVAASGQVVPVSLTASYVPGVLTAQTISLRVGPGTTGTVRMNGTASSRYFGGNSVVSLKVTEITE